MATRNVTRWIEKPSCMEGIGMLTGWLQINLETYHVREVLDSGWMVSRVDATGNPVACYEIECDFGPEASHWTCTCPASKWNRRKPCKHRLALHAALAALKAEPVPQCLTRPALALRCQLIA